MGTLRSPRPPRSAARSGRLQTPRRNQGRHVPSNGVRTHVLEAAEGMALAQMVPDKEVGKAFRLCASGPQTFTGKIAERFKKMLRNNPDLLIAYATNMANWCPDGYTLFLGAAHNNNKGAVEVIWNCVNQVDWPGITPEQLLQQTNLQGRTAFHICAAQGSTETLRCIQTFREKLFGIDSPAPTDLLGMTPLGLALTSPAGKRCTEIIATLFSPVDASIVGEQLSADERCISVPDVRFEAGTAEVPGKRVFMEDYMVAHVLNGRGVLTAVCDGHGDNGKVAKFVGEYLVQSFSEDPDFPLQKPVEWEAVCSQICVMCDEAIKKAGLKTGGAVVS